MFLELFFFGLIGLSIGSFGSAFIHRLHTNATLGGRSRCPHCKKTIRWYDLIPLFSYIALGGSCRNCDARISPIYPILELATLNIFLFAVALYPGNLLLAFITGCILAFLFFACVYDTLYQQIPDVCSILIGLLAIVLMVLGGSYVSSFLGALLPFVWFGGQWMATKGKAVGTGDIFLATSIGLWLGFERSIVFLFGSYISGAILVIILLLFRLLPPNEKRIAFGPFLGMGALIALLGGGNWYLQLLG